MTLPARFGGRNMIAAAYFWPDLKPGAHGGGPAIITGGEATVVVPPRFRFEVDKFGNILLQKV